MAGDLSNAVWSGEGLRNYPIKDRLTKCPWFLKTLVLAAKHKLELKKVWLFGSRALGSFRKESDYDLGFEFSDAKPEKWKNFCVETTENAKTLLKLDLVNYNATSDELRKAIENGILIYDKSEDSFTE